MENFRYGDIIYADRGWYRHYGVYVGKEMVVHYKGSEDHELDAKEAYVQLTPLKVFKKDSDIYKEKERRGGYSRNKTVYRALSEVGKGKGEYNLVFNNCEHFANWCKYGVKKSRQVEKMAFIITGLAGMILVSTITRKDD